MEISRDVVFSVIKRYFRPFCYGEGLRFNIEAFWGLSILIMPNYRWWDCCLLTLKLLLLYCDRESWLVTFEQCRSGKGLLDAINGTFIKRRDFISRYDILINLLLLSACASTNIRSLALLRYAEINRVVRRRRWVILHDCMQGWGSILLDHLFYLRFLIDNWA